MYRGRTVTFGRIRIGYPSRAKQYNKLSSLNLAYMIAYRIYMHMYIYQGASNLPFFWTSYILAIKSWKLRQSKYFFFSIEKICTYVLAGWHHSCRPIIIIFYRHQQKHAQSFYIIKKIIFLYIALTYMTWWPTQMKAKKGDYFSDQLNILCV